MSSRTQCFLDVQIGDCFPERIVIELFDDKTPKTCENFRSICTKSTDLTYKGSIFHRVIPNFCIQGGDITKGNGTGSISIYGECFADENLDWRDMEAEGLCVMANRGPNTNGSQFFITCVPCPHLNGKQTIFGHVVQGMDVVRRIEQTIVDPATDRPVDDVTVVKCGELPRKYERERETSPGEIMSDRKTSRYRERSPIQRQRRLDSYENRHSYSDARRPYDKRQSLHHRRRRRANDAEDLIPLKSSKARSPSPESNVEYRGRGEMKYRKPEAFGSND